MAKKIKRLNKQSKKDTPVTRGSSNVFADLGFENAEELQVKAGLTHQISDRILALGLTQAQAGKLLSIEQPDVSKLMNGRFTGFSTDRLIALLNALEIDVEIVLRPIRGKGGYHRGVVTVTKIAA